MDTDQKLAARRAAIYHELVRIAQEEYSELWKHNHSAARSKAARNNPSLVKAYVEALPDEKDEEHK